jgi:hypothetical protein
MAMAVDRCSVCGGKGSLYRMPCPACALAARIDAVEATIVGAVLAGLVAAAAIGLYFLWKHPIDIAELTRMDAQAALAPTALGTRKVTDFSWVTKAMDACDKEAADDKEGLYLLIIPLARTDKEDPQWAPASLGKGRNANLIPTKEGTDGLKSGILKVYPGEYIFSVSDKTTGNVYRWNPTNGIAKFSRAGAKSIESFEIGFQTLKDQSGAGEANEFTRFEGNCHWVSAIIVQ